MTVKIELKKTDRDNFVNLFVDGVWKALVETSKAPARKTNFRVHGGKGNWSDYVGTKKDFETHVRETFK